LNGTLQLHEWNFDIFDIQLSVVNVTRSVTIVETVKNLVHKAVKLRNLLENNVNEYNK